MRSCWLVARWLMVLVVGLVGMLGLLALAPPVQVQAATFTVTDNSDNPADPNSLRYAVNHLVAGSNAITFAATVTNPITLTNGTLALNQNVTIDGTGATITVDGGCTFSGGQCTGNTGVTVFAVNPGVNATLNALTIQHGSAGGDGGGISNNAGTLTVTNSTLAGNSASNVGGIFNNGNIATITSSTITGNIGRNGPGGLFTASNPMLTNTIVARNTASPNPDIQGIIAASSANNLIGVADIGYGGPSNGMKGNQVGTPTSPLNPLLGPLGTYGGPTQTFPLLPGSPGD